MFNDDIAKFVDIDGRRTVSKQPAGVMESSQVTEQAVEKDAVDSIYDQEKAA